MINGSGHDDEQENDRIEFTSSKLEMNNMQQIKQINIRVEHPGGGMAHCDYNSDGKVIGAHLSGDSPPFVHQDFGTIEPSILAAMMEAASELLESGNKDETNPGQDQGMVTLSIILENNSNVQYTWRFGGEHPNEMVKNLTKMLMKHRIGGW